LVDIASDEATAHLNEHQNKHGMNLQLVVLL
jgi:hypothetical protein